MILSSSEALKSGISNDYSLGVYDALQDKKDKFTHKHLCKKILECSICEIEIFDS